MSILYTPGQLMSALSLSKQQWRTYRQALPCLRTEAGRAACFGAGDLLAAAIAQAVAGALQSPLTVLTPVADGLFAVCGAHAWPRLERSHLALLLDKGEVALIDPDQRTPLTSIGILVELRPLVAVVRERLLAGGDDPQHDLAFPPMVAGGRA